VAVSALNDLEIKTIDEYRTTHQSSILTVMFTDIQGFTEITENRGDHYSANLRRLHDALIDSPVEQLYNGKVVKHCGDSVMAVFSDPHNAVLAALKIQKELRKFNANKPEGILDDVKVRVGIHVGEVGVEHIQGQLDIFGKVVNRASRVEALAEGEQIYISSNVYEKSKHLITDFEGKNLTWTHHGKYRMRGIDDGIEIFEVSEADLAAKHRAPRMS
jgi:class 3 adenylate cyclase